MRAMRWACALGLLALTGCASSSVPPRLCPDAAFIYGLDKQTTGTGYTLSLANIQGRCVHDGTDLVLTFSLDLSALPERDARPGMIQTTYFVALVDEAGTPIDKSLFTATLNLDPSAGPIVQRESFEQRIADLPAANAPRWRLLVGFQLPEDTAVRQRAL